MCPALLACSTYTERVYILRVQTILCMRVAISNPVITKSFVACQLEDNCIVQGEEPPEMWLSVAVSILPLHCFTQSINLAKCMSIGFHCITQAQNVIPAHCLPNAIMDCKLSHVFGAALASPHTN